MRQITLDARSDNTSVSAVHAVRSIEALTGNPWHMKTVRLIDNVTPPTEVLALPDPKRALIASLIMIVSACAPSTPEDEASASPDERSAAEAAADSGSAADSDTLAGLRAVIGQRMPGVTLTDITASPLPGLYEIRAGMEFAYISADGRYLLTGDVTDLETRTAITERRRQKARLERMAALGDDSYITFAPDTPATYTVTVFTDVDCGYCRMLHNQVHAYNDRGIAVRYAFFPRSGANTESFYTAEKVWCSADRKQALTDAKAGKKLTAPRDCENPVARHLQAASDLGLRGTPAIILPDGELIPGYQPPEELRHMLDSVTAGNAG